MCSVKMVQIFELTFCAQFCWSSFPFSKWQDDVRVGSALEIVAFRLSHTRHVADRKVRGTKQFCLSTVVMK